MKTIDLSRNENNVQNRLNVIESIIKASSHYTCGNVDYRREDRRVIVFQKEHNTLYSVDIVIGLSWAEFYAEYNVETGKVELLFF